MEQVIFKIDKKLKEKLMRKAKKEGSNLSAVLKSVAKAYVENEFEMGIKYNPKFIRAIRQSEKEIIEGKILRGDLRELVKRV